MTQSDTPSPAATDPPSDFYIGYRRLPRRHLVFLLALIPLFLAMVFGGSFIVAEAQPPAGTGAWFDQQTETHLGTIRFEPYPVLVKYDEDGTATTYLLVGEGKVGLTEELAAIEGSVARVEATRIERDNQRLLEVVGGADGVRGMAESLPQEVAVTTESLGERTLYGEIVDPKCYFGAMKPGSGKTHRPCAMLCLLGGIPPVLAAQDHTGRMSYYLLTDAVGQRFEGETLEALLPYVGVPVRVTGQATRRGDLLRLAVDVRENIQRTGG